MGLSRRFTSLGLLTLSINGMLGSAWLFAPLYAAKIAGPASLVAWLIAGLATMLIALTFAELSVHLPVAGGTAAIPARSHGMLTGFVMGWIAWLSALTMAPIEVQAVLQYAATRFPSLMSNASGTPVLTGVGLLAATVLMLFLSVVNIASYRGLVRFNSILFTFKVAVIVVTVVTLLHTAAHASNFSDIPVHLTSLSGWQGILSAVASGGVAFAFTGFKHGVELAGETRKSPWAIPLATVGSVFCCMVLYIALQAAFLAVLDPSAVAGGWSHLRFAGDIGPFAGLAAVLGLGWLLKLLYVDAAVSPMGAGLIYVTSTARILYAMSDLGFFPRWVMKLNREDFPVAAIMVNFVIGMFLFLPLPGWQAMTGFLVSGMVLSYAMGPIALLSLRKTWKNEDGFRLPCAQILCLVAFYFCNLISYWTGWAILKKLAIALGIGLLVFVFACLRGRITLRNAGLRAAFWLIPWFAGLVIISALGAFGGSNLIPFGWDFAVMAVFSMIIFFFAVRQKSATTDFFR